MYLPYSVNDSLLTLTCIARPFGLRTVLAAQFIEERNCSMRKLLLAVPIVPARCRGFGLKPRRLRRMMPLSFVRKSINSRKPSTQWNSGWMHKKTQPRPQQPHRLQGHRAAPKDEAISDLQTSVRDLNERVNATERKSLRDRLEWGGDYRFEVHAIRGNIPTHYDGMQMQNLMVNSMWYAGLNGYTPSQMIGLLSSPTLPNGAPNTPANFGAITEQ